LANAGTKPLEKTELDYVTRVFESVLDIDAAAWNNLLAQSPSPTPFMRHEYLAALESSGSATAETGWAPRFVTLWHKRSTASSAIAAKAAQAAQAAQAAHASQAEHTTAPQEPAASARATVTRPNAELELVAAAPLYVKNHSYGEYVFDWAWARAYQEHGLRYYPKAVVAVPFTPVSGSRYLCKKGFSPAYLLREQLSFLKQQNINSLHVLFGDAADLAACETQNLMPRQTVQFHWINVAPTLPASHGALPPEGARFALGRPGGETYQQYESFDHFLASLSQDKRKKIRAERRKVQDAGVVWRWARGADISASDWQFFYSCYERTYLEHGNPPYLSRAFFEAMAQTMPENWLLFTASRNGRDIATSLIAIYAMNTRASGQFDAQNQENIAYGRYWGAIERVDCLHFEACYYQPLQWCIEHGFARFEGGAQGEHKMARGLMPVVTPSSHWLAHPQFADAVAHYLEREKSGVETYLTELERSTPYK
jgi:uncharacterized protein